MDMLESTAIEFDLLNRNLKRMSIDDLVIDFDNVNKVYWVHANLHQPDIFKKICDILRLPAATIKLCEEKDTLPLLVDDDDTLSLRIQCLLSGKLQKDKEIDFSTLIIHLTKNFCLTASAMPVPILQEFIDNCPKSIRYAKTPCFILFLMIELVINAYAKILFDFEFVTDQIDSSVTAMKTRGYTTVMRVKHQAMKVKRYVVALQEILMRISGREIAVISEQCRMSLQNLSNHCYMVTNEIDSIREMLNSLLNQLDNALMQKMSNTMQVLTSFATILLPLSLITGIYGMNFHWMPELNWKYGYFYALGLLAVCGIGLFYIFKKKKYF
ncbi:magnesium transporter [Gammaproteobacteria bacterium SCGC AG-212-F23]|nr:magnesium transporter [Gammaproteobacteria bacterium SCGC AG-212-F23]